MNPIPLKGNWDAGFALDAHTLSSVYLGENEYGRAMYDTTRSQLGELLYELKYLSQRNKAVEIGRIITPFLKKWTILNNVDCILPVPSSTIRAFQPVDEICNEISRIINKPVVSGLLVKHSSNQAKNLTSEQKKALVGCIGRAKYFTTKVNILLIDDLFQSGITLNECVKALRQDKNINEIYVLTMTKTRR